jgi:hopanoid-associated phosphorylase
MNVIAVTGLTREANIVAGSDVVTVCGGGNAALLREKLGRAINSETRGIISIGIAGALGPALRPGDYIVASQLIVGDEQFETDKDWTKRLRDLLPGSISGAVAAGDAIVSSASEKSALHRTTGAYAVDMESHVAARAARAHNLPFAILRVVSDAADHDLPQAVCVAMKPDGGINVGAVMGSLLANPLQLPALIATARDSQKAFASLLRCRDALGLLLGFGGLDLG